MSCFLPDDFDSSKSLALIAGQGIYPQLLAERARKAGISLRLIELGGETSLELVKSFPTSERSAVKVGQVGKLLKELKKLGASYAVMPCCIRDGLYCVNSTTHVEDDQRYALMCGVLAGTYKAHLVAGIDRRITNRNLCVFG